MMNSIKIELLWKNKKCERVPWTPSENKQVKFDDAMLSRKFDGNDYKKLVCDNWISIL